MRNLHVSTRPVPFLRVVLVVVIANYLAQIVYYFHLYFPHGAAPALYGTIMLGLSFVGFVIGYIGTIRGSLLGYLLLVAYLITMVGFYLYNLLNQVAHGFSPFYHLTTHDSVLWVVFAVGYLNMIVGAWALVMLAVHRRAITDAVTQP